MIKRPHPAISKARQAKSDESGVILPLFGLLIVVLLVFAAFAVDVGMAWAQRRQNVSAADAGVMAGALNYVTSGATNPLVIAKVQEFVDLNVDPDVSAADWTACTDSAVDGTNFVALDSAVTQCISISIGRADRARILRVKLPPREVETTFARVIGINSFSTGAVAEAEVDFDTAGGILPFVLPTGGDAHYCIGDVPGGLANDPCDGPQRGKFGDIDSPTFGSVGPNGPGTAYCDNNDNLNVRLALNAAIGLDHIVMVSDGNDSHPDWPPAAGADQCTSPGKQEPNYIPYSLVMGSGNPQPSALTAGFAGDGPYGSVWQEPGRLRQTVGATRPLPDGNSTVALDNIGLWEYLPDSGLASTSDPCMSDHPDYAADGPTATTRLEDCIRQIGGASTPDFIDAILDSPRFALVPRLWLNQSGLDGAQPGDVHNIKQFVPVYVQTTFWNCSATECMAFEDYENATPGDPLDDRQFFSPGEGDVVGCEISGGGSCKPNVNLSLVGVTAWVLEEAWVPPEAFEGGPDEDRPFSVLLYR